MLDSSTPVTNGSVKEEEQANSFLNLQFFIKTFILNWQWILLSIILCLSIAFFYMRYTSPVYEVTAKILVKEDDPKMSRAANQIQAATSLGFVTNSDGFDNEIEVLKSISVAEGAVRDLKLYVNYESEGRLKDRPVYYKDSPILADMDIAHLDTLSGKVSLEITREGAACTVSGKCYTKYSDDPMTFEKKGTLPLRIPTKVGVISINQNYDAKGEWKDGKTIKINIYNPSRVAEAYAKAINISPLSKTTTIASLDFKDIIPERGIDYLKQISIVYNRLANIDKNEVAVRTEQFINQRLEKINTELGHTDGVIENYKKSNNMVDLVASAGQAVTNSDAAEKQLTEVGTQLLLLESLKEYINVPANKYQAMPSNVGLVDPAATALIGQYNTAVLERNRQLASASEISPSVVSLTNQLDDMGKALKRALDQAIKNTKIQRDIMQQTYAKYNAKVSQSPQQERILTEIGRQQEVKSSLYIILLQKREENSISLAATADKGKLIDEPTSLGKVKPKGAIIFLIALILGIALPFGILILKEMLRFRIEGHDDLAKLTTRPIIADIAIANEKAKTKGGIVVHENKNDRMEEIFRGMRTNLQFMMKEGQNVIMFTSTVSGEGKTFVAANLAVSFALLGKKVLLVGLDIRRPRLAALFELSGEKSKGISTLLTKNNPSKEDIYEQIVHSGVNNNLDILFAGPIPPNPAELVSRRSLDDIFAILRKEYDYIIVDTAPVGIVTDTMQIGRVTDITVAVCRADYTEKAAFANINALADANKLPNMCVVLNGIDMSKAKYGYAYGYGHYGKYGHYGYKSSYGYSSYSYGTYKSSHYGNPEDESIKTK